MCPPSPVSLHPWPGPSGKACSNNITWPVLLTTVTRAGSPLKSGQFPTVPLAKFSSPTEGIFRAEGRYYLLVPPLFFYLNSLTSLSPSFLVCRMELIIVPPRGSWGLLTGTWGSAHQSGSCCCCCYYCYFFPPSLGTLGPMGRSWTFSLFLLVRMNHNILVFSSLHDIILHLMQNWTIRVNKKEKPESLQSAPAHTNSLAAFLVRALRSWGRVPLCMFIRQDCFMMVSPSPLLVLSNIVYTLLCT